MRCHEEVCLPCDPGNDRMRGPDRSGRTRDGIRVTHSTWKGKAAIDEGAPAAMVSTRTLLLLLGCAACSVACNSILGLGDYKVSGAAAGAAGGSGGGACDWDPASGACYPCAPTNDQQYLNACTSAECVAFDDATRITKLLPDGGLPEVPELAVTEAGAEAGLETGPDGLDGGAE